ENENIRTEQDKVKQDKLKRLEQEKQKEIQEKERLKIEFGQVSQEKNQEKRRADIAEQRTRIVEQEKQKEIQEKERLKSDLGKEIQEKNKEKYEKDRQYIRAEDAEIRARRLEEDIQKEKTEKQRKDQEMMKLRDEIEKIKFKIPQDFPITIINPDRSQINIIDEVGGIKKIIKTQHKNNCISLSQVLENGVYSMEAVFQDTDNEWMGVGIVQDSYNIPASSRPNQSPHSEHMAVYGAQNTNLFMNSFNSRNTWCKGNRTDGNAIYQNDQIVKMEYDSDKGTLIFFLDNIQQPVYITGIKEKVRFM
ncbi:MAG: hypothetical protein EZS28_049774, partial [Streblomastix strix]